GGVAARSQAHRARRDPEGRRGHRLAPYAVRPGPAAPHRRPLGRCRGADPAPGPRGVRGGAARRHHGGRRRRARAPRPGGRAARPARAQREGRRRAAGAAV
ncbi:MAG: hypothetical protein AVDCRST_MAG06-2965, partial [uncultured Nocardioides sp.]